MRQPVSARRRLPASGSIAKVETRFGIAAAERTLTYARSQLA